MDAQTEIQFPDTNSSFSPSFEVPAPFLGASTNILAGFKIKEVHRDHLHLPPYLATDVNLSLIQIKSQWLQVRNNTAILGTLHSVTPMPENMIGSSTFVLIYSYVLYM